MINIVSEKALDINDPTESVSNEDKSFESSVLVLLIHASALNPIMSILNSFPLNI